jgi:hypothetical protein
LSSPTVPANPVMVDVLDTFYTFIVAKYQLLNPARKLLGLINAQDWPQVELVDGGLYLLYLTSVAIEEDSTLSQTYYEHYLQWAWIFLGNDLQSNQVGFNRSSRYRDNFAVVEELRQVHFPGWCPKQQLACDETSGTITPTPYDPVEMIHWSKPRLGTKLAMAQSGVSYGTAPFEVYAWSTLNPAVNP